MTLSEIARRLEQVNLKEEPQGAALTVARELIDKLEQASNDLPVVGGVLTPRGISTGGGLALDTPPDAWLVRVNRIELARTEVGLTLRAVARRYQHSVLAEAMGQQRKRNLREARSTRRALTLAERLGVLDLVPDRGQPGKALVPRWPNPGEARPPSPFRGGPRLPILEESLLWAFGRYFCDLAGRLDQPIDFEQERARVLEVGYHSLLARPGKAVAAIILELTTRVAQQYQSAQALSMDERKDVASDLSGMWSRRKAVMPSHKPLSADASEAARRALGGHERLMKRRAGGIVQKMRSGVIVQSEPLDARITHELDGHITVGRLRTQLGLVSSRQTITRRVDELATAGKLAVAHDTLGNRQIPLSQVHFVLDALNEGQALEELKRRVAFNSACDGDDPDFGDRLHDEVLEEFAEGQRPAQGEDHN